MSTEYFIACRKCKTTRLLGKFWAASPAFEEDEFDRLHKDLIENTGQIGAAVLLISFLAEHIDHDCVFISDESDLWDQAEDEGWSEDIPF